MRAPKSLRLHIGIYGRRNVGKSSLLNAITRQNVSIVSRVAGTTTDPVEKPMELLPLGPVLFIDTAGLDDHGAVGDLRVAKTRSAIDRTDLGVIVTDSDWGSYEENLIEEFRKREVPVIAVFNKADTYSPKPELQRNLANRNIHSVRTNALAGEGIPEFQSALIKSVPGEFLDNPVIVRDLVGPGEMAVLVVPIDKEAPRGRIIMPQVQAMRDLLDGDAMCMVVKDRELRSALGRLNTPPKLVVTDSQAFLKVAADTPDNIPITSFSILFARFKGNLAAQTEGAMAIDKLRPGDRVLVSEACTHHPIGEDIGRVKIPHWLKQYVGGELHFTTVQGHDFPADLQEYKLVIHCGACTLNRREMLNRLLYCKQAGVPMTNYGLTIAYSLGIFARALEPFPAALEVFRKHQELRIADA